jgi:L-threonylcarbamoyladenylate synthase
MALADRVAIDDTGALDRAAEIIRRGGVIAIPTETFYGLAADATHQIATARIFEIKGRPGKLALPLVAASLQQVTAILGPIDEASARAAKRYWPGPLSLVLSAVPIVATREPTVAVRVPGHDFVRLLCDRAGTLLTATSANKSGEPAAETADAVLASLGELVDLVVDGGKTPGGKPSTIADLRAAEPKLLRDGAIAWNDVLHTLQET